MLAIAVFAGVGIYAMRYSNYDKILPNVYVAGIDVGGMTKDEAKPPSNPPSPRRPSRASRSFCRTRC